MIISFIGFSFSFFLVGLMWFLEVRKTVKYGRVVQFEDDTWAFCRGFFNPAGEPGADAIVYSERFKSREDAENARDFFLKEKEQQDKSEAIRKVY